ncbi:MAG: class I SAM-dependent methyltransferase [Chitinispirillales bacterium]|jgi:SAM-dependent methyltransferase|nr:class I SAM-dependent methyltransferase [Chitinispirillales bacterium]
MRAACIAILAAWVCAAMPSPQERNEYNSPFVPMPLEIINVMLDAVELTESDMVFDLACGDGRVAISAAIRGARGIGIDLDANKISDCEENAKLLGVDEQIKFYQTDFFRVPLAKASVVAIYLLPEVNIKLRPKLLNELKPGSRVVSHDFHMGEWEADSVIHTEKSTIYMWVVPGNVSGTWNWNFANEKRKRFSLCVIQRYQRLSGSITSSNSTPRIRELQMSGDKIRVVIDENGKGKTVLTGIVKENIIEGSATLPDGTKQKWQAAREEETIAPIFFPDGGI